MRISDWSSNGCSSYLHAERQQRHEAHVSHSPLLICDAESASERSAVDRRANLPRRYFFMRILIVVMLADRRTTDCPGAGRNILAVTTADLMADHTTSHCAQNRRSNRMITLFGHHLLVVTFDELAISVGLDAGKCRHG